MTTFESRRYRYKAAEMRRAAASAHRKCFEELYIELALRWERLAEVAERKPEHQRS
jgi:hypothetical protein